MRGLVYLGNKNNIFLLYLNHDSSILDLFEIEIIYNFNLCLRLFIIKLYFLMNCIYSLKKKQQNKRLLNSYNNGLYSHLFFYCFFF